MTKILLVEDDKSLREIYGVRLLAEGYDIVSAGDGEEALAMAIKDRPQLILSDVMMPKISGFDMLDILRSTTETKDIKVIMMTALSSEDQRARGEQLGADRYLVKSQVGIEDVVRTVHDVLGDAPTSSAATSQPTPVAMNPTFAPSQSPAPTAAPAPQFSPQTQPQSSMPLPTAPFSTDRPANLGERIIHPIERPVDENINIADRISQELSSLEQPAAPSAPTTDPVVPVPTDPTLPPVQNPTPPSPTTSQPQATGENFGFEETPRNNLG